MVRYIDNKLHSARQGGKKFFHVSLFASLRDFYELLILHRYHTHTWVSPNGQRPICFVNIIDLIPYYCLILWLQQRLSCNALPVNNH